MSNEAQSFTNHFLLIRVKFLKQQEKLTTLYIKHSKNVCVQNLLTSVHQTCDCFYLKHVILAADDE